MDSSHTTYAFYALGAGALTVSLAKLKTRFELSKAKHRSLTGHARMSRRVAALFPFYKYGAPRFSRADTRPEAGAGGRRAAFARLAEIYRARYAETVRRTAEVADSISDLQFTARYRVPFQFS